MKLKHIAVYLIINKHFGRTTVRKQSNVEFVVFKWFKYSKLISICLICEGLSLLLQVLFLITMLLIWWVLKSMKNAQS